MSEKLTIVFDEYDYKCSDGCCDHYGTTTTINGVELDCYNQDVETIVKQILVHLGIEAEVTTTHNGEGY